MGLEVATFLACPQELQDRLVIGIMPHGSREKGLPIKLRSSDRHNRAYGIATQIVRPQPFDANLLQSQPTDT
jgi:hypothetical protein